MTLTVSISLKLDKICLILSRVNNGQYWFTKLLTAKDEQLLYIGEQFELCSDCKLYKAADNLPEVGARRGADGTYLMFTFDTKEGLHESYVELVVWLVWMYANPWMNDSIYCIVNINVWMYCVFDFVICTILFYRAIPDILENKLTTTQQNVLWLQWLTEDKILSIWQLCRHWWHH